MSVSIIDIYRSGRGYRELINIKERREERGLTQEMLAFQCNVGRTTITMIETGINKPSVALAQKLGQILDCDWKEFFE